MKKIFIETNLAQALYYIESISEYEVYFVLSGNEQCKRLEARENDFHFLKKRVPNIIKTSRERVFEIFDDQSVVFAWDAFDERSLYKNGLFGAQNRLFNEFDFDAIHSFTQFKKLAQKQLPKKGFEVVHEPRDPELEANLKYFFEDNHLAKVYFDIRNGVLGRDYSTKLSHYFSSGRLCVKYFYNYVKAYEREFGSNKSTYWLVFEVLWREFFYWSYQHYKEKFFSLNGLNGPTSFSRRFKTFGFSNDPFMASVLNELKKTGFISNRFRQVFASSYIHHYKLDWRAGATLFEQQLIDYDVYSNWGNWQYQAGVGHDPRGTRVFNVLKQFENYDPNFDYVARWFPELPLSESIKKIKETYS